MSRFPGWTCFADASPEHPGIYLLGLAGLDDDQVWHATCVTWTGVAWKNQLGNIIPMSKPERVFWKM